MIKRGEIGPCDMRRGDRSMGLGHGRFIVPGNILRRLKLEI